MKGVRWRVKGKSKYERRNQKFIGNYVNYT